MSDAWSNNAIQFPRLIAEILATQENLNLDELAGAMGLEIDELNEIFDRATAEWERTKAALAAGEVVGTVDPALFDRLYLISGRVSGDDDDTVYVVEADDLGDAQEAFTTELLGGEETDDTPEVYVITSSTLLSEIEHRLIARAEAKDEEQQNCSPQQYEVNVRVIIRGTDAAIQALELPSTWNQYDYDNKDLQHSALRLETVVDVTASSTEAAAEAAKYMAPSLGITSDQGVTLTFWVDTEIDIKVTTA